MVRALARSLLAALLFTTLVWGGCISCEQYFMVPGAKSCCQPNGHCKTKRPVRQTSGAECKQIAFDHHKAVDLHIGLAPVARVLIEPVPVAMLPVANWHRTAPIDPSPPDLITLHSTFLI